MVPRTLTVALLLGIVTLAGCTDEPAEAEDDEFSDDLDDDLKATDKTGVIRGVVVVDETIAPVPDVRISISNTALSTTTNQDGAFGFSDLEPGSYFLQTEKPGWNSTQASVTVDAGIDKPPVIRILISEDPSSRPTFETFTFEGFLQCSATAVVIGGNVCSIISDDLDRPLITHSLRGQPTYLQSEMVWESTQPLGDELTLLYSWEDSACEPFLCDHGASGESTLLLQMNASQIDDIGFGRDRDLMIRVFNSGLEESDGRVGVTYEQRFTVITVAFYGWTPDEDYRFTEAGAPVPPA